MKSGLVRHLSESRASGPLRDFVALRRAQRDARGTRMIANRMGLKELGSESLAEMRAKSSTLFVLGSGESVEEVTPNQWTIIKDCVSIGVNSWVVHDFIPDVYSFEQVQSSHDSDARDTMSQLLARREIAERAPAVLLLRPHSNTHPNRVIEIPTHLRERTRVYGRTGVATKSPQNLLRDLRQLIGSSVHASFPEQIAIDEGMSIVRMMSLGIRAGFKSIVLVGVDFNSPRYFFDINLSYLERRGVEGYNPWKKRGEVHGTEETDYRAFAASHYIPVFAEAARQETGARVFVSSSSSALAGRLPVFDFATSPQHPL